MDILAALEGTARTGALRCKVGAWLDSIPEDHPGRDRLVHAFETEAPRGSAERRDPDLRTLDQLVAITHQLGHPISKTNIGAHRRKDGCRCDW